MCTSHLANPVVEILSDLQERPRRPFIIALPEHREAERKIELRLDLLAFRVRGASRFLLLLLLLLLLLCARLGNIEGSLRLENICANVSIVLLLEHELSTVCELATHIRLARSTYLEDVQTHIDDMRAGRAIFSRLRIMSQRSCGIACRAIKMSKLIMAHLLGVNAPASFFHRESRCAYPHALLDHITSIHLELRLELILVSSILCIGLVNPRSIDLWFLASSGGELTKSRLVERYVTTGLDIA